MDIIKHVFIGSCENYEECSRKGEIVDFPIPDEKVEAFRNEPPTCSVCGKWLLGAVIETEEEENYRLR